MKTILTAIVMTGSALTALPALAQPAPADAATQLDEAGAIAALESMGFSDIRLDKAEARHFEFDVRDADGRHVEVEIGMDGVLRKLDVDDDARADTVDLTEILPEAVRSVLAERGIVDVHEYEMGPRHFDVEGYNADGREIEIEIRNDDRVGTISVENGQGAPEAAFDEAEIVQSVESHGFVVETFEQKPRHIEIGATNPEGEPVTLHVDFTGEIYRETLDRSGDRS